MAKRKSFWEQYSDMWKIANKKERAWLVLAIIPAWIIFHFLAHKPDEDEEK